MKPLRAHAIVLRRTNYGEADRIVQFLTPEGKWSVLARGVRREKSKLAGGIELFAVSDIVMAAGKGDLGTLTSARLVHFYGHILEDYDRMQFGYEAIKQVARASETVDEPEWYGLLQETLAGLDVKTLPPALTETWFYVRYAALLGHELALYHDIDGQPLDSELSYNYDISEKGLRMKESGEMRADHIKFMRLLAAKPLATVAQVGGVEAILSTCLSVARQHAAI